MKLHNLTHAALLTVVLSSHTALATKGFDPHAGAGLNTTDSAPSGTPPLPLEGPPEEFTPVGPTNSGYASEAESEVSDHSDTIKDFVLIAHPFNGTQASDLPQQPDQTPYDPTCLQEALHEETPQQDAAAATADMSQDDLEEALGEENTNQAVPPANPGFDLSALQEAMQQENPEQDATASTPVIDQSALKEAPEQETPDQPAPSSEPPAEAQSTPAGATGEQTPPVPLGYLQQRPASPLSLLAAIEQEEAYLKALLAPINAFVMERSRAQASVATSTSQPQNRNARRAAAKAAKAAKRAAAKDEVTRDGSNQ